MIRMLMNIFLFLNILFATHRLIFIGFVPLHSRSMPRPMVDYAPHKTDDKKMLKLFAKYTSVGLINTLIHWVIFAMCIYVFQTSQALANFSGFIVAVSFSFFANARFTFNSSTTTLRYMLYVGFMGGLSAAIGWMADKCGMAPIITLVAFSAISLVCGFIYSKFIVFRDAK